MSIFKRYILFLILGITLFSEGLDWNIPFVDKSKAKDKLTQIDKVQELNSYILRLNKTRNSKQNEVRSINSKDYTFDFTNTVFHYYEICSIRPLFITHKVRSYLHLLQLY